MVAAISISAMGAYYTTGGGLSFWEGFYFACFLAGLMLSLVSLLGGMGHIHWHFHGFHLPHAAQGHVGAAPSSPVKGTLGASGTVPWWNAFSIMVFLCWFGAAGYLLTRYGTFIASVIFILSAICGVIGGAIVFWFLARVLMPHDRELTADETSVVGVVGRVSASIRAGGTGEMVYEQLGARRSVPARADSGEPIANDEEVFVLRYESGIAYVRRWADLQELHS